MNPEDKIRKIDHRHPHRDAIVEAARIINSGGVVVFPTTSLYGLGADALNPAAVERVFAIKQRPTDKPILILIPDVGDLKDLVLQVPPAAKRIMDAFWPGNITLVFQAAKNLPACLTSGTGKIGIRLPVYPAARLLVRAAGRPITATSANISSLDGCSNIKDLDPFIAEAVGLILDAGKLKGGVGSTVIDVTQSHPVWVREGAVSKTRIASVLDDTAGTT